MSGVDDMDDLKRLLADNPAPAPDPLARERAMAAARTAFEEDAPQTAPDTSVEKTAPIRQGSSDGIRQTDRQTGLLTLIRRRLMNLSLPSTKQMMMGGASVAVLALAVFAVQDQDLRLYPGEGMVGGEAVKAPISGEETGGGATTSTPEPEKTELNTPKTPELGTVIAGDADDKPAAAPNDIVVDRERRANGLARRDEPTTGARPSPKEVLDEAPAAPAPPSPAVTEEKAEAADGTLSLRGRLHDAPAGAAQSQDNRRRAPAENDAIGFRGNGGAAGSAAKPQKLDAEAVKKHFADGRAKTKTRAVPLAEPEPTPAPTDTFSETGRDKFPEVEESQVKVVADEPVSTFSVDVDTASYAFMRKNLNAGILPAKDAIRVEELINYFPYDYRAPENRETPFATNVTVMDTPWNEGTKLMRIGIKGYEIKAAEKPKSNLVFLIDTSGSMNAPDKLPLLIQSFEMLLSTLGEKDTVAIVAYAGSAGVVLRPTLATKSGKAEITAALSRLRSGGSTAGGEGIRMAYHLAEVNKSDDAVNRVILATDGDFNVGIRDQEELKGFIERKRDTGVFLSVLGFGRGNYNDALMQTLAQNGNGVAAYIDSTNEAQKVLVDEASSSLFPIAKDVKIQVDFNPNVVAEYRLIGYETRKLNREDFNNDKVDAAEIGAGHSVTAIYEITPVGSDARLVDPSRYEKPAETAGDTANEYAFVKIRYKEPDADTSKLITRPVSKADEAAPDENARFAVAVAAFGQMLRGGRYTGTFTFDDVIELANGAKGADPYNYRGEFVQLVRKAKTARAMERQ